MTSLQSALGLSFLGERRKGERRALLIAETLVSAETARPESPPWRGLVPDPDPGTDRVGR